ncbi:MAG: hypothetical protein ACI4TK_18880 [Agathobacter sp.]
MKTNYVPAIVMLLAGAVYCLCGLMSETSLLDFTVQLLIVLLVFYVLGGIIRIVLDKFMGEVGVKEQEKSVEEASKEEEEKQAESEEISEEEDEM